MGIPVAIQNLLNVTGKTILGTILHPSLLRPGSGCHGIYPEKSTWLPLQVARLGFSQGIMPLISYKQLCQHTKGNHSENEVKPYSYHQDPAAVSGGGVSLGYFVGGGFHVYKVFMDNEDCGFTAQGLGICVWDSFAWIFWQ